MSYPVGNPPSGLFNIWSSGSFTPEQVVSAIRDTTTPVNKASLVNSVGQQVSLIQNFVNTSYLGRYNYPIASGWINNLYSSGILADNINVSGSITITPEHFPYNSHSVYSHDQLCLSRTSLGNDTSLIGDSYVYPGRIVLCGHNYGGLTLSGCNIDFTGDINPWITSNNDIVLNTNSNIFSFYETEVRVCNTAGTYTEIGPSYIYSNSSCGIAINNGVRIKMNSKLFDLTGGTLKTTSIGNSSSYIPNSYLENVSVRTSMQMGSDINNKFIMWIGKKSFNGGVAEAFTLVGNALDNNGDFNSEVTNAIISNRLISAEIFTVGGNLEDWKFIPSIISSITTNSAEGTATISVCGNFSDMTDTTNTFATMRFIYISE